MNVLDSSLEALAFSYISYAFVNALWPWIPIVTAAFSFWRIRASSCSVDPPRFVPRESSLFSSASSYADNVQLPNNDTPTPETTASASTETADCECNWVTKGRRFTMKFEDGECVNDGGDAAEMEWRDGGESGNEEWWERWEEVLRTRSGKSETIGWYCYQDLTAINGSVVRLWDDCLRYRRNGSSV